MIYEGSFRFPLNGVGAKYGASVSINNLFNGILSTIATSSRAFLKVIIHEIDIYNPSSIAFCARAILPVKQCKTPLKLPFFISLSSVDNMSSSAFRLWIITGSLDLRAASIWNMKLSN